MDVRRDSDVPYRCNPEGNEHISLCGCFEIGPVPTQAPLLAVDVDASVPHGRFSVAAEWDANSRRAAEVILFAAEGCVPYSRSEALALLPSLFPGGGASWNGTVLQVLYDIDHLPARLPAEIHVSEEFLSLIMSQLTTVYSIHGPDKMVFCYDDYRPRFSTEQNAQTGFPRLGNTPNGPCVYENGQFLPTITAVSGGWWAVSDCFNYVAVKMASNDEDTHCYAVLTSYQFLSFFVPWWRGGPLYISSPDPHLIPAHNTVLDGINDGGGEISVNGYPQVVGVLLGARDDYGALPMYEFGFRRIGAFPQARSSWLVWAAVSSPFAYGACYTGFSRSIIAPSVRFSNRLPPEIVDRIANISVSDKRHVSVCEKRVAYGVRCFPLPCGCSSTASCSVATPVDRFWGGHTKVVKVLSHVPYMSGRGEENWTPCAKPYVFHFMPAVAECVFSPSPGESYGKIVVEWGGLLCPQVDYCSRVLKLSMRLVRELYHSLYARDEMHYPWAVAYEVPTYVAEIVDGVGDATRSEHYWEYHLNKHSMLTAWTYTQETMAKYSRVIRRWRDYQWHDREGLGHPILPGPLPAYKDVTMDEIVQWRFARDQDHAPEDIKYATILDVFDGSHHSFPDSDDESEEGYQGQDYIPATHDAHVSSDEDSDIEAENGWF